MLHLFTLEKFQEEIHRIMDSDDCSVIEAIVEFSENNDIEYSKLVPYINASFKDSVKNEAERKNMIKPSNNQLPF